MDELDRMFRRLVHNIRAGSPDLLARPFEVSALHQHLIPYRLNRGALGIDTAEEYELTLMRLLAGTRGLLTGDPDLQAALKAELESPNPDLSLFRAWGTASVSINPAAVRELDSHTAAALRRPSPVVADTSRQAEMAGRATLEVAAPSAISAPAAAAAARPVPAAPSSAAPAPTGPAPASTKVAPAPAKIAPVPTRSNAPALASGRQPVAAAAAKPTGPGCRYCGGELPEGRDAHFCPHCGQNLTVKQCPACSTELEVEWQYCITCGRQVE